MYEIVEIGGIGIKAPGGVIVSDNGEVWTPQRVAKVADTQNAMQAAVKALMKVHKLSERDAASIMLTVASAVEIAPKSL